MKESGIEFDLDAKLQHGRLFRTAKELGSIVNLASKIGAPKQTVYNWIGLSSYPSFAWWERNFEIAAKLELLTEVTYDELWPQKLRDRIDMKAGISNTAHKRMDFAELTYQCNRLRRLRHAQTGCTFAGSQPDLEVISELLSGLSEAEITVLELRMRLDLSWKEAAEKLSVTWERIRQIERRALRKMKAQAEENNWDYEFVAGIH